MKKENQTQGEKSGPAHHPCRRGRGPSSYWMQEPELVFSSLNLTTGQRVLDLGCGPGDYALAAARQVGAQGTVRAVDKWDYLLEGLEKEAAANGVGNLTTLRADITAVLAIDDDEFDVCLLFTVLHSMGLARAGQTLFGEVRRVLQPAGRLAIIEMKKEDQPFGPPKEMRLAPEELEAALAPHGFDCRQVVDLGYSNLLLFS